MSLVNGRRRTAASVVALTAALTALAALCAPAQAQDTKATSKAAEAAKPDAGTLRVCAAEQPPLSMKDGSGLENRIATTVAEAMGRKAQFVWLGKPAIYLVRDGLEKKTCDVVIGLDADDPRVLTSKPYYRSGYVFLTRADKDLDIKSWSDPRLKEV
ncbi:MAG: methanol oxidation system protein MoxJ, partial [Methylobacteriaceae bacterium]